MDEKVALVPVFPSDEVILFTEEDNRAWERYQAVCRAWSGGARTTEEACEMANVPRSTYYEALKNPYVQQQRVQQIMGTMSLTQEIVENHWGSVISNMVRIARDDRTRDAVAAARFLKDVYDDVRQGIEGDSAVKVATATTFLEKFASSGGKARYKASRHTRRGTEEIEIESP